jgi:hypothetical protein
MIASGREMGVGKERLLACQIARKGNDIQQKKRVKSTECKGKTWLRGKVPRYEVPVKCVSTAVRNYTLSGLTPQISVLPNELDKVILFFKS